MPGRSITTIITCLALALVLVSHGVAEEPAPAPVTPTAETVEAKPAVKPAATKKPAAAKTQPAASAETKTSTTAKPAVTKPAVTKTATVAKPKPTVTRTMETQVSGYTSQDAESLYGRLSLQETRKEQTWYIRGSLAKTKTKNRTYDSGVVTSRIDSRLEHTLTPETFSVWTGVLSRRDRDYSSSKKDDRSGYQFFSYGRGMMLGGNARGDVGFGFLEVFDETGGMKPTVMASVRGKRPLTDTLSLESDTLVLQPLDRIRDTKIDSEFGVSHALSPGLSLKLTWTLNNLIRSLNTSKEWDSGIRLSVSYRHTMAK